MRPFKLIQEEAGRLVADTSTSALKKIAEAMNRKYQEIYQLYNWKAAIVINESFTITSGTVVQQLPRDIAIIYSITERTNDITLTSRSPFIYSERSIADVDISNNPISYTRAGYTSLATDITANGTLTFVSADTDDINIDIRVYGQNAAGVDINEKISLNGTTAVTSTTTWKASTPKRISKSDVSEGVITITDSLSATLDTIAPNDYTNVYNRIELQSKPDKAYTCYVSGKKPFQQLIDDEDLPLFPCSAALVHYGAAAIHDTRGNTQESQVATSEGDRIIASLVTEREIDDDTDGDTYPIIRRNVNDRPILGE